MTKAVVHLIGDVPVTATRSKGGSRLEIAGYAAVDLPEDTEVTLVADEVKPTEAKAKGKTEPEVKAEAGAKGKVTDDDHRVTVLTPDEQRRVLQAAYEAGSHASVKDLEPFKDEAWAKLGPRPRAKKDRTTWWEKWNKALGK